MMRQLSLYEIDPRTIVQVLDEMVCVLFLSYLKVKNLFLFTTLIMSK